MRKTISSIGCIALLAILLSSFSLNKKKEKHIYVLIGTYTNNNSSKGIYVYDLDEQDGTMQEISHSENVVNPSYLALSTNERFIYAVNENTDNSTKGMVSAFSFNKENGTIQFLSTVPSNGDAPCFVTVDKANKNVMVANYNGGNFSVYKINNTGELSAAVQIIQHYGTSANKQIQAQAHVHSTIFSPDEKHVFVCDLGNDTLYQYPFNADAAKPVDELHVHTYKIPSGFGPRHIAFSRDGKFMYLITELEGRVLSYAFESDTLRYLQTAVSTNTDDPSSTDRGSSAIHAAPGGKFLYISNRGDANDLVGFKINKDGTLQETSRTKTDKHPRDFNITLNGKFLLIASQDSNTVKVYSVNQQTGMLSYTNKEIQLPSPVCVIFGAKN